MIENRHRCIICGRKKYESKMIKVFNNSWACSSLNYYFQSTYCYEHSEIKKAKEVIEVVRSFKHVRWSHLKKLEVMSVQV